MHTRNGRCSSVTRFSRLLSVVRNLNDHIAFKIWKDVRPDQKMDINKVASKFGNVRPYQFVARFDHFLRASVSHFTPSEEGAERLMIKYYRYLLQLKKAVYDRYGMIILRNVDMFLEDLDEQTKDCLPDISKRIQIRMEFCLLQLISLQCLAYPKRLSKQ